MSKRQEYTIIQQGVPFSQCKLWDMQKRYFSKKGVDAWSGQVPYYVTTNPYIANSYANIILRFMQDCSRSKDYCADQPIYLLELGSGAGRFAYYTIKRMLELQKILKLEHIKFVYVISDFTQNNIDYWHKHEKMQQFIQQGIVDFALFDVEKQQPLKLQLSNQKFSNPTARRLHVEQLANPLIVLANYLFDSIPNDVFKVENGKLSHGNAELITKYANLQTGEDLTLDKMHTRFKYQQCQLPYYHDDKINQVLDSYQKTLTNSRFLFPIAGLQTLKYLASLANDRMLLISTDKGHRIAPQLETSNDPGISVHGSFSLMVNFDAIGKYFRLRGGDSYTQSTQQSITTTACVLGCKFDDIAETQQACITYLDHFSPGNIYTNYRYFRDRPESFDLETFIAFMQQAHWDPHIVNRLIQPLLHSVRRANQQLIIDLQAGLEKLKNNIYSIPGDNVIENNLQMIDAAIKGEDEPLDYLKSLERLDKLDAGKISELLKKSLLSSN